MTESSIYIHIPFCVKKCGYCDFLSMEAGEALRGEYIQALLKEIREGAGEFDKYRINTIFIGGGTPSLLASAQTAAVLECIRKYYRVEPDAEISMEMNPGTVDARKFRDYYDAGINRVSIGLQSCLDEELRRLGRIHTYADFIKQYWTARETGFENINIDLMSSLPGQSLEAYGYTLEKVCALKPEHISAYSLIIEEGTPFYDRYGDGRQLPDEDTDRQMYERTGELLLLHGYERYEISNYARAGYRCRHNLTYWQRGNYIGMGLGASSMVENVRWKNTSDMSVYLKENIREDICRLDRKAQMEEFMFLGLRLTGGVDNARFKNLFGVGMAQVYGETLRKLQSQGLLDVGKERVCLTRMGLDVSNYVFADFLLE